jgi:predicted phosphodiesterase
MTRYGILSDIHGNLEAFRAALAFLHDHGVDRVLCLGDIVGYNAESNECVRLLDAQGIESIAGNHDLIALGRLGLDRCADKPAFTLRRTRKDLDAFSRQVLSRLPPTRVYEDDVVLIHGGVDDVQQYISTEARVLENHARLRARHPRARVCFFGHTHEARLYEIARGAVQPRMTGEQVDLGGAGRVFFVNPGSVDAARRPGPRTAEFVIYDADRHTVSFHAVPYDHEAVERSARLHGYRMSRTDEWLYRAARIARRGPTFALKRLRARLPFLRPKEDACSPPRY